MADFHLFISELCLVVVVVNMVMLERILKAVERIERSDARANRIEKSEIVFNAALKQFGNEKHEQDSL